MTTIRKMALALALASLGASLQGCAQTTPGWDRQFGASVRANLAAQVLDSSASANRQPATGIDGTAAKGAQERYEHSFAQPESMPPALIISSGAR